MSFILDALRKSESERQQDSKPSIARIPSAVPQHGLPPWALATMAALGLGIVVLGGAWISTLTGASSAETARNGQAIDADTAHAARGGAPERSGSAERASPRIEPLELPPRATASLSDPVTAEPGRSTESRATGPTAAGGSALADSARTSPLAAATQPSPLAMAARNPPSTPRPSTATATATNRPAANRTSLPDVQATEPYHTVAASLGLPELTLQLLAYDENDPSQQYAFINGARYAAGDTLPGGARVIAINSRGAVLLVGGRQLQLEPR